MSNCGSRLSRDDSVYVMKIAHVVATFPPHIGGMGQVARDECAELSKRGHDVTVFTLEYPKAVYQDSHFSFKVIRLRPWIKFGDAGLAPRLFFSLKNFDVVHLHYPFYGGAHWVYLARLLFGQKYVVTYHMDAAPIGVVKRGLQKIYDAIWARRILSAAEKVITVDKNHLAGAEFFNKLSPDKIIELYNSVDVVCFKPRPVALAELDLSELAGKKIILFVGNLLRVKRLDLLFAAVRSINRPDIAVLVVGNGYEENRYKSLANFYGLSDRIKFIGACRDREKLAKYYNVAAALAVPSSQESFSLAAVEAMACGRPVIIGALPGVHARLADGEDSFLFEPGSVGSLSQRIESVLRLDKNKLAAVAASARRKVEAKYSLDRHVSGLVDIYRYVI